ncbi:hypothetical protein WA026_008193 [Henosepilachna vigintioctopunctata]|uniref:Uncharacterized protein n=1 Tax=Henosepilachna vigintioctopunctata TaxID=420089 RepID=A0AAW1TS83_9CUCU
MTEVLLPLDSSVHSDIGDDNISFKILNRDNLPMTISEERIFKPFDSESQKRKPNGIVYPTRRIDLGNQQLNQQKHLAKSNGHLDVNYKMTNDLNFSASHGNLYKITKQKSPDDFTKNLDARLRKLQTDKKKTEQNHLKKPFITTVKKGVFLEPPEISPPVSKTSRTEEELFEENKYSRKQLYAYVSKPMVLSRSPPQHVHRSRCEAAAFAAGLPYNKDASAEDTTNVHKQREK